MRNRVIWEESAKTQGDEARVLRQQLADAKRENELPDDLARSGEAMFAKLTLDEKQAFNAFIRIAKNDAKRATWERAIQAIEVWACEIDRSLTVDQIISNIPEALRCAMAEDVGHE